MSGRRNRTGKSGTAASISSRRRQVTRALGHACEELEVRRLFATVSWITHGDGDWSVGSNWNTGTVPQPNDNVVIDVPGVDLIVTYSATPVLQLANLVNTERLLITGQNGATWNTGTWDGSGVVEIGSSLAIGGSADKIMKDGIRIQNDGSTTLSGTGNIVGQVGAAISNEFGATFDIQSDADITFPTGVGDGIFENAGTVIKSGGSSAAGASTQIGGPQGFTFENSINSLIVPSADQPGLTQVLVGTLQLGDSQNTSLSVGSVYQISSGATLNFSLGAANIVTYRPPNGAPEVPPMIQGAGTLEVSGANVQFYGNMTIHEIDVSGGSLLLQQNMQDIAGTPQRNTTPTVTASATADIVRLSGGVLGGNGGGIFNIAAPSNAPPNTNEELPALIVGTTFQWTGGGFAGTGRTVIDSTVTSSTISTASTKFINGGFGLDLLGETDWSGSGTITMNGGSALWIHSTGTLWDQANGTITQGTVDNLGGNLWNAGIFLKLNGAGTTTLGPGIAVVNDTNPANFINASIPYIDLSTDVLVNPAFIFAKIDIRTGTLSLQGTSINRNNILIHPGATLSFDAGTHLNTAYVDSNDTINASIIGVANGGSINFGAAVFISDSQSLVDAPTVFFGTGSYSFDNTAPGAQRFLAGTFNGSATGQISGNGTIEIVNTFLWNSGTFVGTGGTTSTLLIDSGAVATLASGNYNTSNGYSVDNRGTLQWATSPGTLSVGGNFDQTSTGVFDVVLVGTVPNSLTVSGNVSLAGTLNLSESGVTVTSGETFTLIDNMGPNPVTGTFSGYPEGRVFRLGADTFKISYVAGDGNDVVLTGIVTPTISILTPSAIIRPLSGLTALIFTVKLSGVTASDVTVNYSTSPGTAHAGTDYLTTNGTLTILAGQTTGAISVPIVGTTAIVPAETFTVTLSNPTNGNLGSPASAVGTIVAINGPPVLSFFSTSYSVDESAGLATIVVTSSNITLPSQVSYHTVDGTAIAGVDYVATSGTLVFAAGVSRVTFTVPIIDLGLQTGQKLFSIVLTNPSGNQATLGTATTLVGILDNDGPKPTLSVDNVQVTELIYGQNDAVFTVTLSAASAKAVSVDYTTANGTATEGKYVPQSGTLNFAPGQTTQTISVPINSDFVQNSTETFSVLLSNPVNVGLANAAGIGTILSQTLTVVPISSGHAFKYVDALGKIATITLTGPGSGTITYLGLASADGKQIVLDGTTSASTLSVRTTGGQTAVVNLIVNGSIKAINAPVMSIIGNVTIAGAVQTLKLFSLMGNNVVTIGAGGGIPSVAASFHTVVNGTLISQIPLQSLKVFSWQGAGVGTGISAPSAVTITSRTDWDGDISLAGDLRTMSIAGNLNAAVIRVNGSMNSLTAATMTSGTNITVNGNINRVAVRSIMDQSSIHVGGNINFLTAGKLTNDDIFASVLDTVTTLPTSNSAFSGTTATIGRVAVTSGAAGAFANTLIASPVVGNVSLGRVVVLNNGTTFGVAAESVRTVTGRGTRPIKLSGVGLTGNPFSDFDLAVHLTT